MGFRDGIAIGLGAVAVVCLYVGAFLTWSAGIALLITGALFLGCALLFALVPADVEQEASGTETSVIEGEAPERGRVAMRPNVAVVRRKVG